MGLFNAPNFDFSLLLAELSQLRQSSQIGNNDLLLALQKIKFDQPPMLVTSPAPFNITFAPGEIKEIIPASTSPRRIVIRAISGEVRLLLGTAENIELSAISVNSDRLIDERWQGAIFAYSAETAEIAVNIEIGNSSNSNNNSGEIDDMPFFANKADLIANNANYTIGQTVLLGTTDNTNTASPAGFNTWVFINDVNQGTNFVPDENRLAFTYKTGMFLNLTNPAYYDSFNDTLNRLSYMPDWMIDFYRGREILVYTSEVNGTANEQVTVKQWEKFIIDTTGDRLELFPLRIGFINNPAYHLKLIGSTPTIYISNAIDATLASDLRNFIYGMVGGKILPGEELIFHFKNLSGVQTENPVRVKILGRELQHDYDMYEFTPFVYCFGGPDSQLQPELQLV